MVEEVVDVRWRGGATGLRSVPGCVQSRSVVYVRGNEAIPKLGQYVRSIIQLRQVGKDGSQIRAVTYLGLDQQHRAIPLQDGVRALQYPALCAFHVNLHERDGLAAQPVGGVLVERNGRHL